MSGILHSPRLNRFAVATALTTLMLIGLGGLVTSHGVGMAVPDWPNTYGYNMFLFPISQWVGGIFYEHTHRLLASFVGLLTSVLALWLWVRETRGAMRWGPVGMMLALVLLVAALIMLGVAKNSVFVTLGSVLLLVIGYALYRFFGSRLPCGGWGWRRWRG
jgi:heme A synthase